MADKDITRIQLYKTISYRIISSVIGFLFLYLSTGSILLSTSFGAMELIWKPIQYFLHEKLWQGAEKRAMKKTL